MELKEGVVQGASWVLAARRALQSRTIKTETASQVSADRTDAVPAGTLRAAMRGLLQQQGPAVSERQVDLLLAWLSGSTLEGLVLCNRSAHVLYVNDSLCQMLGRARAELIGRSAAQYFGDMYARFLEAMAQSGGASPFDRYETELRRPTGEALVVRVSTQRIDGADGEHLGCFALVMDISARAKTEAALRQSESELRLLSAQLLAAQELERQRIARELHDEIGQALGGIKFSLETCEALVTSGSAPAAVGALQRLSHKIQSVVEEVRRIAMDLRPSMLDDLGILPTLGWFTREFKNLYTHLTLETLVDVCEQDITAPVKTAIYRIAQEACNNVVTHSQAHKLSLILRRSGNRVELVVHDDGIGFDPAEFAAVDKAGRGLGLASIRERAEMTGGKLRLDSAPGRGTTIQVRWPSHRPKIDEAGTAM